MDTPPLPAAGSDDEEQPLQIEDFSIHTTLEAVSEWLERSVQDCLQRQQQTQSHVEPGRDWLSNLHAHDGCFSQISVSKTKTNKQQQTFSKTPSSSSTASPSSLSSSLIIHRVDPQTQLQIHVLPVMSAASMIVGTFGSHRTSSFPFLQSLVGLSAFGDEWLACANREPQNDGVSRSVAADRLLCGLPTAMILASDGSVLTDLDDYIASSTATGGAVGSIPSSCSAYRRSSHDDDNGDEVRMLLPALSLEDANLFLSAVMCSEGSPLKRLSLSRSTTSAKGSITSSSSSSSVLASDGVAAFARCDAQCLVGGGTLKWIGVQWLQQGRWLRRYRVAHYPVMPPMLQRLTVGALTDLFLLQIGLQVPLRDASWCWPILNSVLERGKHVEVNITDSENDMKGGPSSSSSSKIGRDGTSSRKNPSSARPQGGVPAQTSTPSAASSSAATMLVAVEKWYTLPAPTRRMDWEDLLDGLRQPRRTAVTSTGQRSHTSSSSSHPQLLSWPFGTTHHPIQRLDFLVGWPFQDERRVVDTDTAASTLDPFVFRLQDPNLSCNATTSSTLPYTVRAQMVRKNVHEFGCRASDRLSEAAYLVMSHIRLVGGDEEEEGGVGRRQSEGDGAGPHSPQQRVNLSVLEELRRAVLHPTSADGEQECWTDTILSAHHVSPCLRSFAHRSLLPNRFCDVATATLEDPEDLYVAWQMVLDSLQSSIDEDDHLHRYRWLDLLGLEEDPVQSGVGSRSPSIDLDAPLLIQKLQLLRHWVSWQRTQRMKEKKSTEKERIITTQQPTAAAAASGASGDGWDSDDLVSFESASSGDDTSSSTSDGGDSTAATRAKNTEELSANTIDPCQTTTTQRPPQTSLLQEERIAHVTAAKGEPLPSSGPSPPVVSPSTRQPMDSKKMKMTLVVSGAPLVVPECPLPSPPITFDELQTQEATFAKLGVTSAGQDTRRWMQGTQNGGLFHEMCYFKWLNTTLPPTSSTTSSPAEVFVTFADFVQWYSPADFVVPDGDRANNGEDERFVAERMARYHRDPTAFVNAFLSPRMRRTSSSSAAAKGSVPPHEWWALWDSATPLSWDELTSRILCPDPATPQHVLHWLKHSYTQEDLLQDYWTAAVTHTVRAVLDGVESALRVSGILPYAPRCLSHQLNDFTERQDRTTQQHSLDTDTVSRLVLPHLTQVVHALRRSIDGNQLWRHGSDVEGAKQSLKAVIAATEAFEIAASELIACVEELWMRGRPDDDEQQPTVVESGSRVPSSSSPSSCTLRQEKESFLVDLVLHGDGASPLPRIPTTTTTRTATNNKEHANNKDQGEEGSSSSRSVAQGIVCPPSVWRHNAALALRRFTCEHLLGLPRDAAQTVIAKKHPEGPGPEEQRVVQSVAERARGGRGGLSAVESHGREAASAAGLCAGQTAIRLVAMADRSSSPLITPTHVLSSSSAAGGGGGAQQGSASSSSATTMTLFQELTAIYRTAPWYGEVGFVLSTSFTESV